MDEQIKFRKKPVEIEAIQYDGKNNPFEVITYHQCDYRMCPVCGGDNQKHAYIKTLEGGHIATIGDFIIKGVKGEFYPCKPDIFELTYESSDVSSPSLSDKEIEELAEEEWIKSFKKQPMREVNSHNNKVKKEIFTEGFLKGLSLSKLKDE